MMMADPGDWRTPLVHYLENPGPIVEVIEPPQKEGFIDQDQLERFSVQQEHNQHTKAHNTIYDDK
jgi:hypothetical protein